jgi:N-acyl-phosphatidylethanolamine-hydrolysing phospholipase D
MANSDDSSRDLLYAPHGQPGGFFCPWRPFNSKLSDLLRWKLAGKSPYDRKTAPRIPVVANDGAYLKRKGEPPSVTWIGHSSFAIQDGPDVFLTDPHFGKRALLPPRLSPPGLPLGAIPGEAFALLSHNHYDHLDTWTVRHLPATVQWYVPLGLAGWFRALGRKVVEMDWWQTVHHGRWTLTFLPAQHWSNRLGMPRNSTLWGSWMIESGDRRYYFAGDSGYYQGFAEIGRRFPGTDVALIPIGAYEPRWFMSPQHMDPREAWQSFLDLGARHMIPMHWGTFDLTDEPVDLAPRVLEQVLEQEGADRDKVHLLAVGERWLVG